MEKCEPYSAWRQEYGNRGKYQVNTYQRFPKGGATFGKIPSARIS